MNDVARESFRHNAWATRRLIAACRPLTGDQLTATGVGTFGDVPRTLDHVVRSDGSYARRAAGGLGMTDVALGWVDLQIRQRDLDVLDGWAGEAAALWERVLDREIDVETEITLDGDAYRCRLGVIFAQAINHANHHREQVCAILTGLGLPAPDIQAWMHGEETGRVWVEPAGSGAGGP